MTTAAAAPLHLRPPLKWAGGKRWLVAHVRRIWRGHEHRRLVEPFCGGLAVALGLQPRRALLNDVNPHLVSFYRQLASGFRISLPMANVSETYYAYRQSFNALLAAGREHTAEAAALFYYLNRTGFNGLCRFNSRGEFNVPFGSYARIAYVHDFSAYRPVFSRSEFASLDFEALRLEPGEQHHLHSPLVIPVSETIDIYSAAQRNSMFVFPIPDDIISTGRCFSLLSGCRNRRSGRLLPQAACSAAPSPRRPSPVHEPPTSRR